MLFWQSSWSLWSLRGSVFPHSAIVAALSAALCIVCHFVPPLQGFYHAIPPTNSVNSVVANSGTLMLHPAPYGFFLSVAGLMVAFHTTSAYQRFWEARSQLQIMLSALSQAACQMLAFEIPGSQKTAPEISHTQQGDDHKSVVGVHGVMLHTHSKHPRRLDNQHGDETRVARPRKMHRRSVSAITISPSHMRSSCETSWISNQQHRLAWCESNLNNRESVNEELRASGTAAAVEPIRSDHNIKNGNKISIGPLLRLQSSPSFEGSCATLYTQQVVHLYSVLSAVSFHYLLGKEASQCHLEILGDLTASERIELAESSDPTFLVWKWIHESAMKQQQSATTTIVPPTFASWNQCQHTALMAYDQTCKIEDTTFPFPYMQLLATLVAAIALMSPLVISSWTPNVYLSAAITFVVVFTFHALSATARLMETPFGRKPNDLPLVELHNDFIARLRILFSSEGATK